MDGREARNEWMQTEWVRISVPQWREALAIAEAYGHKSRALYAEWMLSILVLPDSEVKQFQMRYEP